MLLDYSYRIREGFMTGKKRAASTVLMMILLLSTVGARNFVDIGLKVVTLYDADQGLEDMTDGYNWDIGVGFETRVSILHVSGMITNHEDTEYDNGMNFYASALFDVPVINDFLYLKMGGGISNTIYLPGSEEENFQYGRNEISTISSFREMIQESPIHLKAGIDIMMGPALISLFYVRETDATFEDSLESIVHSSGTNKIGAGLTLSMF